MRANFNSITKEHTNHVSADFHCRSIGWFKSKTKMNLSAPAKNFCAEYRWQRFRCRAFIVSYGCKGVWTQRCSMSVEIGPKKSGWIHQGFYSSVSAPCPTLRLNKNANSFFC